MASEGPVLLHSMGGLLQKCFCILQEQHEAWKRVTAACTPLLDSLANLAEQMRASQRVVFARTPLGDFVHLPERLRRKQQCAVEALLREVVLGEGRAALELQKVRDAVGLSVAGVFLFYGQHSSNGHLEHLLQRSALCPSLADMLEWLRDIEGLYHRTYLEAKLLLQIGHADLAEVQALPKAWAQVLRSGLQDTVEGNHNRGWWNGHLAAWCHSPGRCSPSVRTGTGALGECAECLPCCDCSSCSGGGKDSEAGRPR
uniref:Chromosome 1 open reading frame 109 n=1 Tax=Varanus komodoensis TaxID=61221 RepID=A0A8D2KZT3_VARKO